MIIHPYPPASCLYRLRSTVLRHTMANIPPCASAEMQRGPLFQPAHRFRPPLAREEPDAPTPPPAYQSPVSPTPVSILVTLLAKKSLPGTCKTAVFTKLPSLLPDHFGIPLPIWSMAKGREVGHAHRAVVSFPGWRSAHSPFALPYYSGAFQGWFAFRGLDPQKNS